MKRNDCALRYYLIIFVSLGCFGVNSKEKPVSPVSPEPLSSPLRFYTELAPPFYFLDPQGKPQGASLELAHALMAETQIPGRVIQLPWARAFRLALNEENIVLITALRTPARESKLQWLGRVSTPEAYLIGLADNPAAEVVSLEQAKNRIVATIRGYGSASYLQQQGFVEGQNLELLVTTKQQWSMLYKRRVDLVLSNIVTGRFEIRAAGLDPNQIVGIHRIDDLTTELDMATGLKTDEKTVNALRQGLKNLKENGRLQAIMLKWGIPH
ncbi:substrate-binding periplasmic protein [Aliiglaciecola litoralis]